MTRTRTIGLRKRGASQKKSKVRSGKYTNSGQGKKIKINTENYDVLKHDVE